MNERPRNTNRSWFMAIVDSYKLHLDLVSIPQSRLFRMFKRFRSSSTEPPQIPHVRLRKCSNAGALASPQWFPAQGLGIRRFRAHQSFSSDFPCRHLPRTRTLENMSTSGNDLHRLGLWAIRCQACEPIVRQEVERVW